MAASLKGREVLGGGPAVDYEGVEAALQSLWKRAAEDVAATGSPPVTRVTTLNLVVLAGAEPDAGRALELAGDLAARHPGRVLVVRAGAGADGVTAEVSAQCHRAGGGRQVCSEQVLLTASGRAAQRAAQIVAPLLLPDLPVVLCLPARPLSLPVDDDLLALADRVVADAGGFPDAASALACLAAWADGRRAVVDLAWLRLERWRALTAQLFDDPAARGDLGRLESVEVEYVAAADGGAGGRVEALYYLGWIANRLGRALDLRLRPGRGAAGSGEVSRVCLTGDGGHARYEVERLEGRQVAEVRVGLKRPCPAPARVGLATQAPIDLLSAVVFARAPDAVYEEALAAARVLADAC